MKKIFIVIGIVIAITFTMTLIINVTALSRIFPDNNDNQYRMYENIDTFEFSYLHLSDAEQTIIDQNFAQYLIDSSFDTVSSSEGLIIINAFKTNLLDDEEFTYESYYYGGMMGRRYDMCDDDFDAYASYEWRYVHLDNESRNLVDQTYVAQLMTIDFTALTLTEVVSEIDAVKTYMVTYIESLNI